MSSIQSPMNLGSGSQDPNDQGLAEFMKKRAEAERGEKAQTDEQKPQEETATRNVELVEDSEHFEDEAIKPKPKSAAEPNVRQSEVDSEDEDQDGLPQGFKKFGLDRTMTMAPKRAGDDSDDEDSYKSSSESEDGQLEPEKADDNESFASSPRIGNMFDEEERKLEAPVSKDTKPPVPTATKPDVTSEQSAAEDKEEKPTTVPVASS